MKRLNLWVVTLSLGILGMITFTLCLLWDLAFPSLSMLPTWGVLLPGFQGITWGSYWLGLAEIVLYAFYTAAIFVPTYNWLTRLTGQPTTEGAMRHV
jgi:hypothetical protein